MTFRIPLELKRMLRDELASRDAKRKKQMELDDRLQAMQEENSASNRDNAYSAEMRAKALQDRAFADKDKAYRDANIDALGRNSNAFEVAAGRQSPDLFNMRYGGGAASGGYGGHAGRAAGGVGGYAGGDDNTFKARLEAAKLATTRPMMDESGKIIPGGFNQDTFDNIKKAMGADAPTSQPMSHQDWFRNEYAKQNAAARASSDAFDQNVMTSKMSDGTLRVSDTGYNPTGAKQYEGIGNFNKLAAGRTPTSGYGSSRMPPPAPTMGNPVTPEERAQVEAIEAVKQKIQQNPPAQMQAAPPAINNTTQSIPNVNYDHAAVDDKGSLWGDSNGKSVRIAVKPEMYAFDGKTINPGYEKYRDELAKYGVISREDVPSLPVAYSNNPSKYTSYEAANRGPMRTGSALTDLQKRDDFGRIETPNPRYVSPGAVPNVMGSGKGTKSYIDLTTKNIVEAEKARKKRLKLLQFSTMGGQKTF